MRFEYLEHNDKDEFLKLFDVEMDKDLWENFWDTYSESDTKVIHCAWIFSKELNKDILIGSASLLIEYKPHKFNPTVYITDFVVLEQFRRLGLGKIILLNVIKEAGTYYPSVIKIACREEYHEYFENIGFKKTTVTMEYTP